MKFMSTYEPISAESALPADLAKNLIGVQAQVWTEYISTTTRLEYMTFPRLCAFADLAWRATADGAVLLDGASGWLEVSVEQEVRAGDHDIVVLAVHDLDAEHDLRPLVFHASQFRRLDA